MARPHIRLKLPEEDRKILQSWLRASNTKRILAERAEMILLCGEGLTATQVSQQLSKRLANVQMWRKRYLKRGLSGLHDRPRSGRPRKLGPAKVRAILKATVESIPRESTQLECATDGPAGGSEQASSRPDLEGGRPEAASDPQLQDQQ